MRGVLLSLALAAVVVLGAPAPASASLASSGAGISASASLDQQTPPKDVNVAVLIAPLIATDVLPIPQRAIEFFTTPDVMPVVPEPPRAPSRSAPRAVAADTAPSAPTEAPKGITPETGLETITATAVSISAP